MDTQGLPTRLWLRLRVTQGGLWLYVDVPRVGGGALK